MASELDKQYTTAEYDEEGLAGKEHLSVISIFNEFLGYLLDEGWELVPSCSGEAMGSFNVCKQAPTANLLGSMTGLNDVPRSHTSYLKQPLMGSFQQAVSDVAFKMRTKYSKEKGVWDMVSGFELSFSGLGGTFQGFNLQRYYLARSEESNSVITLGGAEGCHKIVPLTDWFDSRIQDITAKDLLLHLAGDAEREVMQLFIGRVACGGRYHKVREHFDSGLDTGSRIMPIMVGEAGNGKSFSLGILSETFHALGYEVAAIEASLGKGFGWERVASADFALLSDLSSYTVNKLVGDSSAATRVLQFVTGDRVDCDVKNARSVNLYPRCGIAFATNEIPIEAQISPNEGMVSRSAIISTVTRQEIGARLGMDTPQNAKKVWEKLLEERGIEPTQEWLRTLAAWLIRLSVDHYLATCGYDYYMGSLEKARKVSLEDIVEELKGRCKDRLECKHKYELPDLAIRALATVAVATGKPVEDFKKVPWTWRTVELMWSCLKTYSLMGVDLEEFTLPSMARSIEKREGAIEAVIRRQVADNSEPSRKHSDILSFFQTDMGIGYPRKIGTYSKLWDMRLEDLEHYIKQVKRYLDEGKIPNTMLNAAKKWAKGVLEDDL